MGFIEERALGSRVPRAVSHAASLGLRLGIGLELRCGASSPAAVTLVLRCEVRNVGTSSRITHGMNRPAAFRAASDSTRSRYTVPSCASKPGLRIEHTVRFMGLIGFTGGLALETRPVEQRGVHGACTNSRVGFMGVHGGAWDSRVCGGGGGTRQSSPLANLSGSSTGNGRSTWRQAAGMAGLGIRSKIHSSPQPDSVRGCSQVHCLELAQEKGPHGRLAKAMSHSSVCAPIASILMPHTM